MSALGISSEDVRLLEDLRQKFWQLSQTIASLKHQVAASKTLPEITSLQAQMAIAATNLASITHLLHAKSTTLHSLVVYPSSNFPGREVQPGIVLTQLLRKKPEVAVEKWIESGRNAGRIVDESQDAAADLKLQNGQGKGYVNGTTNGAGLTAHGEAASIGRNTKAFHDRVGARVQIVQRLCARAAWRVMHDQYTPAQRALGKEAAMRMKPGAELGAGLGTNGNENGITNSRKLKRKAKWRVPRIPDFGLAAYGIESWEASGADGGSGLVKIRSEGDDEDEDDDTEEDDSNDDEGAAGEDNDTDAMQDVVSSDAPATTARLPGKSLDELMAFATCAKG